MSRSFGGMSKFGGGGGGFQQQQQQYGGGDSYEPSDLGGGDAGGFQGTQGEGDTPRAAKRSGAIVQTLTPVTVRQLHLATHTHPDDIFKVDDRELNQITLVGQIVNLQVQSTNVELEVDDGTGKIGVRMWLDVEEDNQSSRKWDVGSYVRVIGNLRSFMDTRSVLAFRVMPIEMYDEVTYHFLDVIHVHLAVTKGELDATDSASAASGGRATSGYGGAQRGGGGGGYGGRQAAPAGRAGGQFSPCQKAVLEIIRTSGRQSGAGCALGEVIEVLQTSFSEEELRESIEWLTAEGHLYTAGDDFFRCSE